MAKQGAAGQLLLKVRGKKEKHGQRESGDAWPGQSKRMLTGHAEMGSGKPRHRWN